VAKKFNLKSKITSKLRGIYQYYPDQEFARKQAGLPLAQSDPRTIEAFNEVFQDLNSSIGLGDLRGRKAAEFLRDTHQTMNLLTKNVTKNLNNSEISKTAAAQGKKIFTDYIKEVFDAGGTEVGKKYRGLMESFEINADTLEVMRKALSKGPLQREAFMNNILAPSPKKRAALGGIRKQLEGLVPNGKQMLQDITDLEIAKNMAPKGPQLGMMDASRKAFGPVATVGGALSSGAALFGGTQSFVTGAKITGLALPVAVGGGVLASSPSLAARTALRAKRALPYAQKMKAFIDTLSKNQRRQLSRNEAAVAQMIRAVLTGISTENSLQGTADSALGAITSER